MESIFQITNYLVYVYEEIFWLKEFLTTIQSGFVFFLVWWVVKLNYKAELLLYLSAFIGIACVFFGDMGFWSDNDVLKFVAPGTLFLLMQNKDRDNNTLFFAFLIPFFITSFEFYRSFLLAGCAIITHLCVISVIVFAGNSKYSTYLISAAIAILFNYIGYISSPGTSDILINPALISLGIKGIEIYKKEYHYTDFLKSFWFTLLCFAYFGSWIFHVVRLLFNF